MIDLALKAVPEVESGIHYVERQFGVLEVHAADPDTVERAGQERRRARGSRAHMVSVSMIGAAGRLHLAGETLDIVLARDEIGGVLAAVAGREH